MIQDISIIQIVGTIVIIGLTYFVYERIIKPYQNYSFYKKVLCQNYRTEVQPFTLLGLGFIGTRQKQLQKYGDTHYSAKTTLNQYQLRLMKVGSDVLIDILDPELIKEYYEKTKDRHYQKNFNSPGLSSIKSVIGSGLFLSEGDDWKKKKKILSNVFNFDFIHSKIPLIAKITQQKINQLSSKPQNIDKNVLTADITNFFQKVFGTVVIKSFFGDIPLQNLNGQDIFSFINDLLIMNVKRAQTPFAFLIGKNFFKFGLRSIDRQVDKRSKLFLQYSKDIINNLIKQHQQSKGKNSNKVEGIIDLVIKRNLIILENEKQQDIKQKYTINQMVYQITTFFLAGTQTTSTMMTGLIYTLANRPDLFAKAKEQVRAAFLGSTDILDINEQKLKKCKYLDYLVKQGLRVFPPAPTLSIRSVVKQHYLGKIPMKKGLQVTLKMLSNQFKEEFWKNPMEFDPQRWRDLQPGKQHPFSFFPFSHGNRVCIGQHLALLQAKIVLVSLLKTYKQFKIERPDFKLYERFTYGPEPMQTFLTKQ